MFLKIRYGTGSGKILEANQIFFSFFLISSADLNSTISSQQHFVVLEFPIQRSVSALGPVVQAY